MIADGRATAPPLPECLDDEHVTAVINATLRTPYTMEHIQQSPEIWIQKVMQYANALNT